MILVSGATGFLGAHVVCYILQQGETVRALKRPSSSLSEFNYIFSVTFDHLTDAEQSLLKNRLIWFDADILDIPALEGAFEGMDEVYHCAATVSFLQKHKNAMMEVNEEGTANMVNLALIHRVKKFCHVSSIAALGREKSGMEISEKTKWTNSALNTNYALSKYKAEMEVWRGIEEGLNAVIVNPGVILGVGDWQKGSCKLFNLPWKNFPFYTNGTNGYTDVRDVARAMFTLMQKPQTFAQRYVLVSDNMNMQYFMQTVAVAMKKKVARFAVTRWMAETAWVLSAVMSLFTGKEATITRENARASLNTFLYSSNKIKEAIGFEFIPIRETLTYISNQYIQNHTL